MNSLCPCGSKRSFDECCGAIMEGRRPATTAEELMRSRYTAFTMANADYLMRSWHPQRRNLRERAEIARWARSVQWMGLEILSTREGGVNDSSGYVRFRALFVEKGIPAQIQENSYFARVNGLWVYVSGEHE